jgi:D-xylose transport system permease protein
MTTALERDPRLVLQEEGFRGVARAGYDRLRSGELGSLPVVIGLIVIALIFQIQTSGDFFKPSSIEDLVNYMSFGGVISLGILMVLLLGEIDLSVGSMSGLCGCIVAVLNVKHGWGALAAIIVGVAVGAALGALQGAVFSWLNVPSFVVTLAGLLAWYGFQLKVLGKTGTIPFTSGLVYQFYFTHYGTAFLYIVATLAVAAYLGTAVYTRGRQASVGLAVPTWFTVLLRTAILAILLYLAAWRLSQGQGISLGVVVFLGLCIVFALMTTRTTYGRHVFAVGGNIEAARRAGINVNFIRISVFAIAGAMAALGGVLNASYNSSADQSLGGNTLLLYTIAAAVIGGTSLFGGRGSAWSALLGWLVLASIYKGMDLLSMAASVRNIIIGAVLLAAAVLDAIARRGRQSHGRA